MSMAIEIFSEINNLVVSKRGITLAEVFLQLAAGKQACEFNEVNINPHGEIKFHVL